MKIKEKYENFKKEKISPLLLLLIVLNTVSLLIANIIACKTFNVFKFPNLDWYVVLPCAVIIFPITYILSDVISEVYGYIWSRRASWISFAMNLLMVLVFEIAIIMPGETDLSVLHSTWFLLMASLIAYMIGDLMNDIVFKKMKQKDQNKKVIFRCILSSLVGEFCDSLIYIPLGMFILPRLILGFEFMSLLQVLVCIILQPIFKVLYEIAISPITLLICKKLKKTEEENNNIYNI